MAHLGVDIAKGGNELVTKIVLARRWVDGISVKLDHAAVVSFGPSATFSFEALGNWIRDRGGIIMPAETAARRSAVERLLSRRAGKKPPPAERDVAKPKRKVTARARPTNR